MRQTASEAGAEYATHHPVFRTAQDAEWYPWTKAGKSWARRNKVSESLVAGYAMLFADAARTVAMLRADHYKPVVSAAQVEARRAAGIEHPEAPLFVSYGLGVDSTAMLVGLHSFGVIPDAITFADTGSEKPETYAYLPVMNEWLRAHGMPEITVVKYGTAQAKNGKGSYSTLEEQLLLLGTLPGIVFGFGGGTYGKSCSQKWKVGPQERHDREHPVAKQAWFEGLKVNRAIGYDCGAADSKRSKIPEDDKYTYTYPLRVWGWDRAACKAAIAEAGLPVPPKSACWFCPATKPEELREFVTNHPEYIARIVAVEAAAAPSLTQTVEGLWATECKGVRDPSKARPASWTEFLTGTPLVTKAREQRIAQEELIRAERLVRKNEKAAKAALSKA